MPAIECFTARLYVLAGRHTSLYLILRMCCWCVTGSRLPYVAQTQASCTLRDCKHHAADAALNWLYGTTTTTVPAYMTGVVVKVGIDSVLHAGAKSLHMRSEGSRSCLLHVLPSSSPLLAWHLAMC
jgi:hypothetical protein